MKIALVHDWLTGMRGGEKCLEDLCRHFPDAQLFTLLHRRGSTSPAIERMRMTTSPLDLLPGIAGWYRWALPLMPWAMRRLTLPGDLDLVVSFSHAVAKSVRVPPGVPHVCYCFTPMRYAWNLREDYFPAAASRGPAAWLRKKLLDRIRDWDRRSSSSVTRFVAISRTVQERIRQCYGRDSTIIHPPVDCEFYTPQAAPREDFYLVVSALVPYKRIDLAMEACRQLRRPLVVIGRGPQWKRLAKMAGPTVQLLGWRCDEEVRDHLRRCRALLFPGHEDFGIVPLEAQACGTPVIALERGGATETLLPADKYRTGTGVFFKHPTAESLMAAMAWFERHPERLCETSARTQALRFSRERYSRELIRFLEQVVSEDHAAKSGNSRVYSSRSA